MISMGSFTKELADSRKLLMSRSCDEEERLWKLVSCPS